MGNLSKIISVCILIITLTGCGGGGGSENSKLGPDMHIIKSLSINNAYFSEADYGRSKVG